MTIDVSCLDELLLEAKAKKCCIVFRHSAWKHRKQNFNFIYFFLNHDLCFQPIIVAPKPSLEKKEKETACEDGRCAGMSPKERYRAYLPKAWRCQMRGWGSVSSFICVWIDLCASVLHNLFTRSLLDYCVALIRNMSTELYLTWAVLTSELGSVVVMSSKTVQRDHKVRQSSVMAAPVTTVNLVICVST